MSIYFHCRRCRTPVARIEDYLGNVLEEGVFKTAFNVEVSDTVNNHPILDESTLANAYCVQCKELLGGKFIAVDQTNKFLFVIEGRFLMNMNKLMRNEDQDGDITGLDEDALDQHGDGIDQHEDTTEKNGDANDQCGATTEHDGDANEQNANQDLGTNEQNADQDLSANGQNADQDRDANEQVPKEQNGSAKQNDDDEMEAGQ